LDLDRAGGDARVDSGSRIEHDRIAGEGDSIHAIERREVVATGTRAQDGDLALRRVVTEQEDATNAA